MIPVPIDSLVCTVLAKMSTVHVPDCLGNDIASKLLHSLGMIATIATHEIALKTFL